MANENQTTTETTTEVETKTEVETTTEKTVEENSEEFVMHRESIFVFDRYSTHRN